jgi:hypothetical protein
VSRPDLARRSIVCGRCAERGLVRDPDQEDDDMATIDLPPPAAPRGPRDAK